MHQRDGVGFELVAEFSAFAGQGGILRLLGRFGLHETETGPLERPSGFEGKG